MTEAIPDSAVQFKTWLTWIYEGRARQQQQALDMLAAQPVLFANDPWVALATGNANLLRGILEQDPAWVNNAVGPLGMKPLIAVTHSQLLKQPQFESSLMATARLLLDHGTDVNQTWLHPDWQDAPLSALYGAAGKNHHPAMTRLLLESGANPDDNESLYHSVESPDPACTLLLLEHGARVAGTNALGHVLDFDKLELLKQLLAHDRKSAQRRGIKQDMHGQILHHALRRGRSIAHIQALVDAGADLQAVDPDGISVYRYAQMLGRPEVARLVPAQLAVPQREVAQLVAAKLAAAKLAANSTPTEAPNSKAPTIQALPFQALTPEEHFIATCARAETDAARQLLASDPTLFARLTPRQLTILPELAAIGNLPAVRTMLAVGWPREIKTGWGATALNHAVYRGDAPMTALLLAEGADWRAQHNFGDNVLGTLSWSSQAGEEGDGAPHDYLACAQALSAAGVPLPPADYTFSPEVEAYFNSLRN